MLQIILAVAVLLVLQLITAFAERRRLKRFQDRFPPLSDADFVARCGPDIRPEVALKVRSIVSVALGVDYERIHPEARFVEDLDAN